MRSSLQLFAVLVICTACPSPTAVDRSPTASAAVTATAVATSGACEFFGARFVPMRGFKVQEHRESGVPYSRVSFEGFIATHPTVVSIIPREMRPTGDPTATSQAQQYFEGLRNAIGAQWTDIRNETFEAASRSHPMMRSRAVVRGPVDRVEDNAIVLFFPTDFPAGRHFYVFFWTDIHASGDTPNPLTELQTLVESFQIKTSPRGTPAGGCV